MTQPVLIHPPAEAFASGRAQGKSQVVWARTVADLETPVTAMLKLQRLADGPSFLLESVLGGETRGRYSAIGLLPDLIWRCQGADAEQWDAAGGKFTPCAQPGIAALRALLDACRLDIPRGLPPMAAGLVGYLTYDMVKQMERLPDNNPDSIDIPQACLMRPGVTVIFDALSGAVTIAAPVWADTKEKDPYAAAAALIRRVMDILAEPLADAPAYRERETAGLEFASNFTRQEYHGIVAKAKEYIAAGDIFQVVPSQRFTAPFTLPSFALYRALRHLNPSPFLFHLDFRDFAIVGASPEILVRLRDGRVTIRPIAGTRKRGATPEEDAALAEDLIGDAKECAEHLMLLDLGRNDVGRVSEVGSIAITERMVVERYSHVMHIVSNVEGTLKKGLCALDALMAGFPAGTVSGAPKIRAMEIIDELEKVKRSFYGGCVGYFSANGSMDTCIALRTGLVKDGTLTLQAGGGVVADSDPDAEYEETVNKAKAMMRAAEEAARFA